MNMEANERIELCRFEANERVELCRLRLKKALASSEELSIQVNTVSKLLRKIGEKLDSPGQGRCEYILDI